VRDAGRHLRQYGHGIVRRLGLAAAGGLAHGLDQAFGEIALAFLGHGHGKHSAGHGGGHLELLGKEGCIARIVQLERQGRNGATVGEQRQQLRSAQIEIHIHLLGHPAEMVLGLQ